MAKHTRVVRNALAPGILAAVALLIGMSQTTADWYSVVRFVVAILAAISCWFAIDAKHWWWLLGLAPIVIAWNPVSPFAFEGPGWVAAHAAAAGVLLFAGLMIRKVVDVDPRQTRRR